MPENKVTVIINQIQTLLAAYPPTLKDLQSVLGRLLWLTGAWHHLRPLLNRSIERCATFLCPWWGLATKPSRRSAKLLMIP